MVERRLRGNPPGAVGVSFESGDAFAHAGMSGSGRVCSDGAGQLAESFQSWNLEARRFARLGTFTRSANTTKRCSPTSESLPVHPVALGLPVRRTRQKTRIAGAVGRPSPMSRRVARIRQRVGESRNAGFGPCLN